MKLQIHTMKIYIGNLVNDPGKTPKGKPVEESSFIYNFSAKLNYINSRNISQLISPKSVSIFVPRTNR